MIFRYNNIRYARATLLLLVAILTGCDEAVLMQLKPIQQDSIQEDVPVVAPVAFAVSKAANNATRQTPAVVQEEGQTYRDIDMRHLIPFAVKGKIGVDDMPKAFEVYGNGEKPVAERNYYYYENCQLMSGVRSFLSYGVATAASTDKHVNGSIVETFPLDLAPKDIRFSLESINTGVHSTAIALTNYMTAIATAQGNGVAWKDAPNASLRIMFLNFVNQIGAESGGDPLPGSAANIKAFTGKLKENLNSLSLTGDDAAIREAIIEAIDENYDSSWDYFPASIGLPDGAAVVRWTGTAFEPQITTTTLADINGIDRFAYPAELYYYGNSRIKTSTIDKRKESYTDRVWSAVLADFEYDNGVVSPNTTAVAIKEPLQYGVAHVKLVLKHTDNPSLTDAKGTSVTVNGSFPLTGIIIGGQLPVGFDFTPTTAYPVYSEADMKFIYDSQVKTNGSAGNEYFYLSSSADATKDVNTLTLQSYDHKKVPVVLEFQNNSNVDFTGLDGIVYRGTKFYLVSEVDPENGTEGDTFSAGRVFTQDYTTTLNVKVMGLDKAYNVLPNLLSPRLEMGIELVPKWVATTPDELLF